MINTRPDNFDSQLKALKDHGYSTITADQFKGFLAGQPLPDKSVLLTFDDGYLDNWVYAHPILARYGMSAVIFLITHDIGSRTELRPVLGEQQDLPYCPDHEACKTLSAEGRKDELMLRWAEVHAMREAGTFEFHSHTHTHTRWDKKVPRPEKITRINEELVESRRVLTEQFGQCSDQLCWPQGFFDDDYVDAAQKNGFEILYTTNAFGFNRAGTDPLRVYRIPVTDRPGKWLIKRLDLARSPIRGPIFNKWKSWRKKRRQARQRAKA